MASPTPEQELEQRNRLPTLMEVLGRRTLAPVDLFSFYIYMRDQQRSVDYLDFWLDVSQHMSLCRHYVRELRRSMLVDTPDMDKATNKQSPQLLDRFDDLGDAVGTQSEKSSQSQKVSAYLRSESGHRTKPSGNSIHDNGSQYSMTSRRSNNRLGQSLTTTQDKQTTSFERRPGQPFISTSEQPTDSQSPGHSVARADIKSSAEKILYTFILEDAERKIVLPPAMVQEIVRAIEEEGRDDPEVFDDAKDYVFQAMDRDAFPGFLQAKALGNLVPLSILIRLIVGLLALFGGFWAGYYLILTDARRSLRCWVILPYTIGCYFIVSHQYKLDVLAAYAGFSEYTWMNWSRVREPFVRKLLLTRASIALLMFIAATVALCVLFIFVPGTRF